MRNCKEEGLGQHFGSYEEMVEFCETYIEHPDLYDTIRSLCGLYPNEGDGVLVVVDGEEITADASLKNYITGLNAKGYRTLACCSGLLREHEGAKFSHNSPSGYMCVYRDEDSLKRIRTLPETSGINIDMDTDCYFQPAINIKLEADTDDELARLWEEMYRNLVTAAGLRGGAKPKKAENAH